MVYDFLHTPSPTPFASLHPRRLVESLSLAEDRASGHTSHQMTSGMYSRDSPTRTSFSSNPHRTSRRENVLSSTFRSPAAKEAGVVGLFRPSASEGARGSHYRGDVGFKTAPPQKRQDHLRRTGSSEYLRVGGLEQGGMHDTTGGPDLSSLSAGSVGYGGRSSSLQPSPGSHGDGRTGAGGGDTRLQIKLEAAETRLHQCENEVCMCRPLCVSTHIHMSLCPSVRPSIHTQLCQLSLQHGGH